MDSGASGKKPRRIRDKPGHPEPVLVAAFHEIVRKFGEVIGYRSL
ncbi:hypothetical protein AB0N89_03835 [Amycolatopsis sp. NPDC089917]